MGNNRIQKRRNQTNARKIGNAQEYHVRMKNKKKYHKGKQQEKLERRPNNSAKLYMKRTDRYFW